MCGICGEFRPEGAGGMDRESVKRMTALLAHRGPDAEGHYFSSPSALGLGHRRLSIIDLPGGSKPMSNEYGSLWVGFNGEINNFQ
jgi:asparagine synthase (glutamine-hydrolysing)